MADPKKPNQPKPDPEPASPPDDDVEVELSDEKLDKIAGGLAKQRFDGPRIRPITSI
jgi:hypothetical protein